ncbi:MAG: preprotein translocase subunit SecA [Thioalkalivibrionaceae bacterium]
MKVLLSKLFGSRNDRLIKRYRRSVEAINRLEPEIEKQSDDQLRARIAELRAGLTNADASCDAHLPEVFALTREMARRVLGMRHFDVQLIGGMVLHDGRIAEMRTGEGKTLVATLPVVLNALVGQGVHVITVNDYLARRDAAWMGQLYHALGLSVGVINTSGGLGPDNASFRFDPAAQDSGGQSQHLVPCTRREAYACDITYGTNNEFGFDYLRDNMAFQPDQRVQRGRAFAVIDEVDSILIDEARTPLIISGPSGDSSEMYQAMNAIPGQLVRQVDEESEGDFFVDEKARQVFLSEDGQEKCEQLLHQAGLLPEGQGLYDAASIALLHHLNAALRAHALFQRDVHYLVRDRQVLIIDEFTGRVMPGRRWSEGLHQAIEAKEGLPIQQENQTLASITFQNYFRTYDKLAGMTGTADTEAYEFQTIYGLEVVVIPGNRPLARVDHQDLVFLTDAEKYEAIIEDIRDCHERGQPVLVGTASVESSERLANALQATKIPFNVLNAKQHEREAGVIADAGLPSGVTIATNMAGRGTDIVLGGSLEAALEALPAGASESERARVRDAWQERHDAVVAAGGLHVIGTERHESRRIDNQLRGRSGRQGDPGSSRFYLSLEDNLMRIFASDRVKSMMTRLGMERGEAIENSFVSRAIENAQRKVEAHNFDIRKQLLEYDDVANDQRRVIYEQRNELLDSEDVSETVHQLIDDVVNDLVSRFVPPESIEDQWDIPGLEQGLKEAFGLEVPVAQWLEAEPELHEAPLRERLVALARETWADKRAQLGVDLAKRIERDVVLQVLDHQWKEHLAQMDYLRQGIGLRGYAQRNPKQEYKREAFEMFEALLVRVKEEVVRLLMRLKLRTPEEAEALERASAPPPASALRFQHASAEGLASAGGVSTGAGDRVAGDAKPDDSKPETYRREGAKLGRNDPCWCGSGKKFKHCHGKLG